MKNLVYVFVSVLLLAGCVKVNLLPEDAVKNSIKAGKNIYDESKLKHKGGKKREYSKQVLISDFPNREESEKECFDELKSKLSSESNSREAVIVSERAVIIDGVNNNVIECQLVGYVWSGA
ncbi:hypothetical protein [Teredinibacter haidensis]|uniref:hypothetical protein n=1 Tax=Teredinibacter haidensis TaxID=2731755 RepID=UPI0009488EDF|nr:hypothetical protein [Teredinibacter haidensis]